MKDGKKPSGRVLSPDDFKDLMFNPEPHFEESERQLAKLDIGWAKAALGLRTLGEHRHGHGNNLKCQSLLRVFELLEAQRERFEDGDTMALLHGVYACADENVPLPTWLAIAFQEALQQLSSLDGANSLDEVFVSPHVPKGTPKKAAAAKQDRILANQLWFDAWNLAHEDKSIASIDALVSAVLSKKSYGVKKTKARKLILDVEDVQRQLRRHPPSKHLSRFLEKRRKR